MVQWLGHGAFTGVAQVQFLVGQLRSIIQLAQGLTAVSSGKVKVMSMTHSCIMEEAAWKDGIFCGKPTTYCSEEKQGPCTCIHSRAGAYKTFL